jgi:hypothetical protein
VYDLIFCSQAHLYIKSTILKKPFEKSIIIIGDIHGRPIWKNIIARHPEDEIIFVGDYFDSKEDYSAIAQIFNFHEILNFKRANQQRVTLLFGNHDFHYLPSANERYSGYQYFFAADIYEALKTALDEQLLQVCCQKGKFLISHAGLTKTWCRNNKVPLRKPEVAVNRFLYENPEAFRFSGGKINDPGGDEPEQGPLWVRPASLYADNLQGVTQIVGHTQRPTMLFLEGIVVVDVLAFSSNYLEINSQGNLLVQNCGAD